MSSGKISGQENKLAAPGERNLNGSQEGNFYNVKIDVIPSDPVKASKSGI